MHTHLTQNSDANKFRDEFDKYKNYGTSDSTQTEEEDKLTKELDKLKVDDDQQQQQQDTSSSEQKSDESSAVPSGEGVNTETNKAAGDEETKKAEDTAKKDESQDMK